MIGATAQGFRIFPVNHIDVRYVTDDDYRKALKIKGDEKTNPIQPREYSERYHIIDELESKQLIEKSLLYTDKTGETLFPLNTTFRKYDDEGNIKTYDYKYAMAGADAYTALRPTYKELIKDIPGYEYVADDFEKNTNQYYNNGELSKLPEFDYEFFPETGEVRITKHFYVTYKKLSEPPTPPEIPPRTPPETPPDNPPEPPNPPKIPKTGDENSGTLEIIMMLSAVTLYGILRRKYTVNI